MMSGRNGDRSAVPPPAGRRRFRGAVLLLGMLATRMRPAAPAHSASVFLVAERPDRFLIYNK
ncbi:hypothetical protein EHM92_08910, partial [bacterium]